jgi:hypothetical protein
LYACIKQLYTIFFFLLWWGAPANAIVQRIGDTREAQ